MNTHRIGRPHILSNSIIKLLTAIRYIYGMPYRQLEGFTRALHRLVPYMPTGDYSGLRRRILSQPVDPYAGLRDTAEPVTIAVDSTGISVHKTGGWVKRKHGKKRRYIKLHFAVNTETHEVVGMEVSADDTHNVKALPGLVDESGRNAHVARVIGGGAYDSSRIYGLLEGVGIDVVVKPKRNARSDHGHPGRRRAVGLVWSLGYDGWARLSGYGRRWAVETAYSTFKRLFGEHSLARDLGNIVRGLAGKVSLYDMLVNM